MQAEERLDRIMVDDGLTSCGNSGNCVRACPKEIPLTTSIAKLNRAATVHSFKRFFG